MPPNMLQAVAIIMLVWATMLTYHSLRLEKGLLEKKRISQKVLDILSEYLYSGDLLKNKIVGNPEEYNTWVTDLRKWHKEVQSYLRKELGQSEQNLFVTHISNTPQLTQWTNSYSLDHDKWLTELTNNLVNLKDIIERYSK
ncbi:MAG: hypothetical protein WBB97_08375 [Dehalococcoidales bacterium]